ncbi:TIGR02679 family protein [Bacillus massilinigeriensis]|uniref:TIGR02679 family protein n=1 Tax=Bacillus mediterraneensis TaxID=1805474 RepID=UPI0008F96A03|nr:TIGR02679 family protein [Bacillus mediterraneensis]
MEVLSLVAYIKSEKGLNRLFSKLTKRYKQLGRIGGSVKLDHLDDEERESLAGFFGKDFSNKTSATISFVSVEKALSKTRYSLIPVETILNVFEGKALVPNRVMKEKEAEKKAKFFLELSEQDAASQQWIKFIAQKGQGARVFHNLYDRDPQQLKNIILTVGKAVSALPKGHHYVRLPVFAQRLTKDPHAFDLDTEQGKALLHRLQFIQKEQGTIQNIRTNLNAEEANVVLHSFRIFRDDMLNYVTVSGLIGYTEKGPHPVWEAAAESDCALNFPLREIAKLYRCKPVVGRNIFIVENSGVFSSLLDHWSMPFPPPLICTNGQLKLAALWLIDIVSKENNVIHYSGDHDPEGLLIAQKLKKRAPDRVRLWRYSIEDYLRCRSNKEIPLERIAGLNAIDLEGLFQVKEALEKYQYAGYQEELIDTLLDDMERSFLEN